MSKILSLDVGEKRIGLATTDELLITCSPFGFIARETALEQLGEIIESENIQKLVVGMPFLPSGNLGSQAEDVQRFIDNLKEKFSLPIEFENEVLTSIEAERRLRDSKKSFEKGDIDSMAACIILESYLRKEQHDK